MTRPVAVATIAAVNRWVPGKPPNWLTRRAVGAAGAAALILATMVVATNLGATVRLAGPGPALPDRRSVDYGSRGSARYAPLRRQYVEDVLGLGPGDAGLTAVGTLRGSGPVAAAKAASPGPIVVAHPFTNGDFAHAYDIAGVPFAARTNTSAAKRQAGEPSSCSAVGGTAWYRFVPPTSMTLQADTVGTKYTTALGVFTGSSLSDLTPIGCSGGTSQPATVGFLAIQGRAYFFQIAGPVGGGDLHFQLSPHPETLLVTSLLSGYHGVPDNPALIAGGGHATPDFRTGVVVLSPSPSDTCNPQGSGTCNQTWLADERGAGEFDWSRQSVSSTGEPANGSGFEATTSADGRMIAFDSVATNLVNGDSNGIADIFVRDRATGRTSRESISTSGAQLAERPGAQALTYQRDGSLNPYISEDGRYVAYQTNAAHLAPDDTCTPSVSVATAHGCFQIMLRDRYAGTTTLVTRRLDGAIGNSDSLLVGMAGDGRYLLIESLATNLTAGPATTCASGKSCLSLLLWDRETRRFEVVSTSSDGTPANGQVGTRVGVSRDGRFVSFASVATNLVPGDTSGTVQTYVRDRSTGTTDVVSVGNDGVVRADPQGQLNDATPTSQFVAENDGRYSSVSDDGRFVAFNSSAGLLPRVDPGISQVYVRDRQANRTVLISVNTSNQAGNAPSVAPLISPTGNIIYFASYAFDLVANDNNNEPDAFYRGWRS